MDVSIVADAIASGSEASGSIAVSGTAEKTYEIRIIYNGETTKVMIDKGDASDDIAAKIETKINQGKLLTASATGSDIDLISNEKNKYANKEIFIEGTSSDITFTIVNMQGATGELTTTNLQSVVSGSTNYKLVLNSEEFEDAVAKEIKVFGESRYDKFVNKPFVCFHATNKDVESIGFDEGDRTNSCCVVLNSHSAAHEIIAELGLLQATLEMDQNAMSLTEQILPNIHCPDIPNSITKVTALQAAGFMGTENKNGSCKINLGKTRGTQSGFIYLASIFKNIKVMGFMRTSLIEGGYLGRPVVDNAAKTANTKAIDTKIIKDIVDKIYNTLGPQAIIDSAEQAIEDSEVLRDPNDSNIMYVINRYRLSGNLYVMEIQNQFKENA